MKLKEAYSILELPSGTPAEDVKKRYREISKKKHPDIDKTPGAEDRFKKINEAYNVIINGESEQEIDSNGWDSFIRSHVSGFSSSQEIFAPIINLSITVSFKESILGCKQNIKYKRNIKCQTCNGIGSKKINNGCAQCGGRGQVVQHMRGMIMVQPCSTCHGVSSMKSCDICNENGFVESETSISVTVPGGIQNNNILRLSGMGNYAGNFGPIDQYTDVHLKISVISEEGLSLEGLNVISILEISLLEALAGCNKTVKTIMGLNNITVNPLSKNKDEILIPKLGVNAQGNHKIILDVKYPEDTVKLISLLNESI